MIKELDFKFPLEHTVKHVISVNWFGENGMKSYLKQALDIKDLDLMGADNDTVISVDLKKVPEELIAFEAADMIEEVVDNGSVEVWQLSILMQGVIDLGLLPPGDYLIYYSY